jgi:hypothetical protein
LSLQEKSELPPNTEPAEAKAPACRKFLR